MSTRIWKLPERRFIGTGRIRTSLGHCRPCDKLPSEQSLRGIVSKSRSNDNEHDKDEASDFDIIVTCHGWFRIIFCDADRSEILSL